MSCSYTLLARSAAMSVGQCEFWGLVVVQIVCTTGISTSLSYIPCSGVLGAVLSSLLAQQRDLQHNPASPLLYLVSSSIT